MRLGKSNECSPQQLVQFFGTDIQVQAGAGGTESMDWASMVMQMYKMWAQHRGYRVTVVDEMPGEMAGIKVQSHHPLYN